MRTPDRDTAVFSTSAIDLFASALGAFILLVMLLFPYYRHAGPDESFSMTQAVMEKRRLASDELVDTLRLAMIPGVGPRIRLALLERFGSPQAVLAAEDDRLTHLEALAAHSALELAAAGIGRGRFCDRNADGDMPVMDRKALGSGG